MLVLALSCASLPILLFGMYQARTGLERVVSVAALCALVGTILALLVMLSMLRGLNNVGEQVRRMSAADLQPLQLPGNPLYPEEMGNLILNFNKLIQEIGTDNAARDAVMQSEKMITLGELVAGTSHELNNPLAIVTGYADLLLEENRLTDQQRSKVESIRTNALRASNVVHGLLAFARKRKPERTHTDLNEVVEMAIQLKEYDLKTSISFH